MRYSFLIGLMFFKYEFNFLTSSKNLALNHEIFSKGIAIRKQNINYAKLLLVCNK